MGNGYCRGMAGVIMPYTFRHECNIKRRLTTQPIGANWNSLINYWATTYPFPGWDPDNPEDTEYPGEPMPNEQYDEMLKEAQKYLGYSYLWGGKTPPYFDCSGFVGWCYKYAGIIPESVVSYTGTLQEYCDKVPDGEERPGDLVFWNGTGGTTWEGNAHVGIYIGNGKILDDSGGGVAYRDLTWHGTERFAGYYRPPE